MVHDFRCSPRLQYVMSCGTMSYGSWVRPSAGVRFMAGDRALHSCIIAREEGLAGDQQVILSEQALPKMEDVLSKASTALNDAMISMNEARSAVDRAD